MHAHACPTCPTHLNEAVVLEYVGEGVHVRLAGEVETRPDVPLGTDHALGQPVVQAVDDIGLLVHDGVVEVCLDLAQERRADLVGNVLLLFFSQPVFLTRKKKIQAQTPVDQQ